MSQNRTPPAYQEYAATMLAKMAFRTMSLQDRGLFYTMRLECWENIKLPSNTSDLAKVLGISNEEVSESLDKVMPFFTNSGEFLICPELEYYRAHLMERKTKQSQGGKRGSVITNEKRKKSEKVGVEDGKSMTSTSTPRSNSKVSRQVTDESLVKQKIVKESQNQFSESDFVNDPFVHDYQSVEEYDPNDYRNESNGQ